MGYAGIVASENITNLQHIFWARARNHLRSSEWHRCGSPCHTLLQVLTAAAVAVPQVSAKMGLGIEEVLEAVVKRIPAPTNRTAAPLRALIFDSYYDAYRGVVCQFRVQVRSRQGLIAGGPRCYQRLYKSEIVQDRHVVCLKRLTLTGNFRLLVYPVVGIYGRGSLQQMTMCFGSECTALIEQGTLPR